MPKYLLLHFVRFQWRQDTGKKAKILRAVKFPLLLDMRDFCTDEYKARIDKWRNKVPLLFSPAPSEHADFRNVRRMMSDKPR